MRLYAWGWFLSLDLINGQGARISHGVLWRVIMCDSGDKLAVQVGLALECTYVHRSI